MKFIKDLKANLSLVVSKAFLKKAAYFFGTVALITALLAILPDPAKGPHGMMSRVRGGLLVGSSNDWNLGGVTNLDEIDVRSLLHSMRPPLTHSQKPCQ